MILGLDDFKTTQHQDVDYSIQQISGMLINKYRITLNRHALREGKSH